MFQAHEEACECVRGASKKSRYFSTREPLNEVALLGRRREEKVEDGVCKGDGPVGRDGGVE